MGWHDADGLGASLYVPATRADLAAVVTGMRGPPLRSVIVCLEDAVAEEDLGLAHAGLAKALRRLVLGPEARLRPRLFLRPRAPAMLRRWRAMPGLDRVEGFVLPKVTVDSLGEWLNALGDTPHRLMPTVETREAFDGREMARLRRRLLDLGDRVLAVRIGGNDLLKCLGARRSRLRTAYDGPLGPVIARLVGEFAPWGLPLSAPVFEGWTNPALLAEEVERDLEHGLMTKSCVHPAQAAVIEAVYRVDPDDLAEARHALAADGPAVFAGRGAMVEPATHAPWARRIVGRAERFGLRAPCLGGRDAMGS